MPEIGKVVIVGAGTMGHALALLFAEGGFEVQLVDKDPDALEKAIALIDSARKTLLEAGFMSPKQEEVIPKRINVTEDLAAAAKDSDLAIETVNEDPVIKKQVFALLDQYCPEHTILASNTSGLNIFHIINIRRPGKVLITHFFAPPYIIPLVEVVPGPDTEGEVIDTVIQLLKSLGKEPLLLKKYIPGFIVNRIQRAISREAFSLVAHNYASIEDVDNAIKASLGVRLPVVGIFQTYDFTGLDAYYKICQENPIELAAPSGPPAIVKEKVERGELGIKTGKGLYDYSGKKREEVLERRDLSYINILRALKNNAPL
jgi:3-hydroxybutyryl-CoA dehydrogenase